MENNWKDTLKVTENKEEKRILELQRKIKANEIQEDDLSYEDIKKVRALYHTQNEKLRCELEQYRNKLKKILKK